MERARETLGRRRLRAGIVIALIVTVPNAGRWFGDAPNRHLSVDGDRLAAAIDDGDRERIRAEVCSEIAGALREVAEALR